MPRENGTRRVGPVAVSFCRRAVLNSPTPRLGFAKNQSAFLLSRDTNGKWLLRGVAKAKRQEGAKSAELLLKGLARMLQWWQFYQSSLVLRHLKEEKYLTWEAFLCQKDLFYFAVCFDNISVDHQQEALSFCVAIALKMIDKDSSDHFQDYCTDA